MGSLRLLLICLCAWSLNAATYYADDTGSGSGCTIGTPCTLQTAFNKSLTGGDIIEMTGNCGSGGTAADTRSGTAGNYITLRGSSTNIVLGGETVIEGDYWIIETFQTDDLEVHGDDNIIRNIHGTGANTADFGPIRIVGSRNTIHDCYFNNWDQNDHNMPAILLSGGSAHNLIISNVFNYNNGHDCIRPFGISNTITLNLFTNLVTGGEAGHSDHADILQLFTTSSDSPAQHIIFERNTIVDSHAQVGNFERFDTAGTPSTDWSTNMFDIHVRFNTFEDFRPQFNIYIQDVYVYNNSMINSSNWTTGMRFRYDSTKGSGDNGVYRNNIHLRGEGVAETANGIALTSTTGGGNVTNITESHNLVSETDDTSFTSIQFLTDSTDINNGDVPSDVWVDQANGDWTLKAGSPAIAAGTNLTSFAPISFHTDTLVDFDGNAMPVSGPWDIGALQFLEQAPSSTMAVDVTVGGAVRF